MISILTWQSAILNFLPVIIALCLFYFIRERNKKPIRKKEWYFILGFIVITLFYIVANDPEVTQALYLQNNDYTTPIFWAVISGLLLFIAIYYFKKHLEA